MIKVAATHEARSHVLELASVFRARVVDVAPESLTIEITGAEDKIDGLLEVLRPYGVLEMVRTGIVAMRRGKASAPGFDCRQRRGRGGRRCFALGVVDALASAPNPNQFLNLQPPRRKSVFWTMPAIVPLSLRKLPKFLRKLLNHCF